MFKQEVVVFTGVLSTMTRKQAKAMVYSLGATTQDSVTKKTTILVVGTLQVDLLSETTLSTKYQQALNLINQGYSIKLMTEKEFFTSIKEELKLWESNFH